jgi:hypothetical protein
MTKAGRRWVVEVNRRRDIRRGRRGRRESERRRDGSGVEAVVVDPGHGRADDWQMTARTWW